MTASVPVPVLARGNFFEAPRWYDGNWYVSDLYADRVLRVSEDGVATELARVAVPAGLGRLADGSLLIVSMTERRVLRLDARGVLSEHADLSGLAVGLINDMVVDRTGRAWVGSFGFDAFGGAPPAPGNLVTVAPDGGAAVAAEGLRFPNGMVRTADTLVVAETFGARLTAFTVSADGSLGDRRVFAQLGPTPPEYTPASLGRLEFAPDGCALDADGHIWVADALHPRLRRVAPGGSTAQEIVATEGLYFYSAALGGADGRTLLACLAPSSSPERCRNVAESVLLSYRVDVPAPA